MASIYLRRRLLHRLREETVGGYRLGNFPRIACIMGRKNNGAFSRLRSIGMAACLTPYLFLLHAPAVRLTDRLTGISTRAVAWGSIQQGKQFFIQPSSKILFPVFPVLRHWGISRQDFCQDVHTAGSESMEHSLLLDVTAKSSTVALATIHLASEGTDRTWSMRRRFKSPNYAGDWNKLSVVS